MFFDNFHLNREGGEKHNEVEVPQHDFEVRKHLFVDGENCRQVNGRS